MNATTDLKTAISTPLLLIAQQNFVAAARVLEQVGAGTIDLTAALQRALGSRPQMLLNGGYLDLPGGVGVCLPAAKKAKLATDPKSGIMIESDGLPWMTIETNIPAADSANKVFVYGQLGGNGEVVSDVFIRKTSASGGVTDLPAVEMRMTQASFTVCQVDLGNDGTSDERSKDQSSYRLIVQLREPARTVNLANLYAVKI